MPINQPGEVFAIEAIIGPRGQVACTSVNRAQFRRWITAKGWGADFAAILSIRELSIAYNNPAKGGGEPGRDAWLDKRLREFKQRQGEAQGKAGQWVVDLGGEAQGAMDLGADLGDGPVDPKIMEDLKAEAQREADVADLVDLGIERPHDNRPYEPIDPKLVEQARDLIGNKGAPDGNPYGDDPPQQRPDENDPDKPLEQKLQDDLDDILNVAPKPAPKDKRAEAADKAEQLAQMIRDLVEDKKPPVDPIDGKAIKEIVDQRVKEALEKAQQYQQREIIVKRPDGELMGKVQGRTPPWFERVLHLLQAGQNVLLVGPSGCGKSHNARLLAEAMGVEFGMISGSAGASESQLSGWLLPVGEGGKFVYVPSDFVKKYQSGKALFCLDEIDAFDPNMLVSSNGATANGHFYVPHRYEEPCVMRGENAMIMATANTFGTGANPLYCGRNPLDATTLDRYIMITVDYDIALEKDIAEQGGLSEHEAQQLWDIREKVREQSLRRVVSTRAFQKAVVMKSIGDEWPTIIDTLTAGWTRDERAKAGL